MLESFEVPEPWTHRRNRKATMRLIVSGDLQVDPFISHVAKPEEANDLYRKIRPVSGVDEHLFDWESD